MNYLIGIVVIALAIAYVILRKRKSDSNVRPDESQEPAGKPDSTFHAVSLKFSTSAAKDMGGRPFLSGVAPRIPLPGCDANECRCKFVHHSDRRLLEGRRSPFRQGTEGGAPEEQRTSSERREDTPDDTF